MRHTLVLPRECGEEAFQNDGFLDEIIEFAPRANIRAAAAVGGRHGAKLAEFCPPSVASRAAGAVVFVIRAAQNWRVLRW